MTRASWIQLAAVAAVVALCVGGFFACFEKKSIQVPRGLSAEALANRHLALVRLLGRMGHPVAVKNELAALAALPEPPAAVFLTGPRQQIGRERSEQLLRWVERGGDLVVVTYTTWEPDEHGGERPVSGARDWLLDRFGLRQRTPDHPGPSSEIAQSDPTESESDEEESAQAGHAEAWDKPESAFAFFADEPVGLELRFDPRFHWDAKGAERYWRVDGEHGAHVVEIPHGAGRILAFTSDEPLVNGTIGDADHAEFVVRWLRLDHVARQRVWVFVNEAWPSLATLLVQHAWRALAAAAALLALWLWRSFFRFGPVLPSVPPARRRWLEHLEAVGRFHWRGDRGAALLAGLRGELERQVSLRHPAWLRLPERERLERLARVSGLALPEVARGLLDSPRDAKSFTAVVRAIERVRAAL